MASRPALPFPLSTIRSAGPICLSRQGLVGLASHLDLARPVVRRREHGRFTDFDPAPIHLSLGARPRRPYRCSSCKTPKFPRVYSLPRDGAFAMPLGLLRVARKPDDVPTHLTFRPRMRTRRSRGTTNSVHIARSGIDTRLRPDDASTQATGAPDVQPAEAAGPKRHEAYLLAIVAERWHRLKEWRVQRIDIDRDTPRI